MISFTNTIDIDHPTGDVYDYLVDLEHLPECNWAISETTKVTPGPTGVGTHYRQTRTTPHPDTETLQITALVSNRHIEIRGTLAGLDARVAYDLDDTSTGTRLTNTVDLETTGVSRLASRILGPRIRHSVADNLHELQTRLTAHIAHQ